jgi:hypothetical protein
MNQRVQIPMLIGITHTDCSGACPTDEIMVRLGLMNDKTRPPVIKVNPNERSSVVEAVMASMAILVAHYSDAPQLRNKGETNQSRNSSRHSFSIPLTNFSRGR